jgi:hypothetical protein
MKKKIYRGKVFTISAAIHDTVPPECLKNGYFHHNDGLTGWK